MDFSGIIDFFSPIIHNVFVGSASVFSFLILKKFIDPIAGPMLIKLAEKKNIKKNLKVLTKEMVKIGTAADNNWIDPLKVKMPKLGNVIESELAEYCFIVSNGFSNLGNAILDKEEALIEAATTTTPENVPANAPVTTPVATPVTP